MMRRVLAAALATVFLSVTAVAPSIAEEKKVAPQQQKMKDCGAKWQAEKAKTGVKGRAAYRKFVSECLKAPA